MWICLESNEGPAKLPDRRLRCVVSLTLETGALLTLRQGCTPMPLRAGRRTALDSSLASGSSLPESQPQRVDGPYHRAEVPRCGPASSRREAERSDAIVVGLFFASKYLSESRSPLTRRRSLCPAVETFQTLSFKLVHRTLPVFGKLLMRSARFVHTAATRKTAHVLGTASESRATTDLVLIAAHVTRARNAVNSTGVFGPGSSCRRQNRRAARDENEDDNEETYEVSHTTRSPQADHRLRSDKVVDLMSAQERI